MPNTGLLCSHGLNNFDSTQYMLHDVCIISETETLLFWRYIFLYILSLMNNLDVPSENLNVPQ